MAELQTKYVLYMILETKRYTYNNILSAKKWLFNTK